jgi:hypothetical protein
MVKDWWKKKEEDSATASWISSHTKDCPKCQTSIEKNGGCNHMWCKQCKHEFCWVCLGKKKNLIKIMISMQNCLYRIMESPYWSSLQL